MAERAYQGGARSGGSALGGSGLSGSGLGSPGGFGATGRGPRLVAMPPAAVRPVTLPRIVRSGAHGADGLAALWATVSGALRARLAPQVHQSWIAPLSLAKIEDGVAHIAVPTAFLGSYVGRTFGDAIVGALAEAGRPVDRLAFDVTAASATGSDATPAATAAPTQAAAPSATPAGAPDLGTRLDPRYTFARFVTGPSNEMARAAAQRLAEGGAQGFNPLVIHGGVGLGKTHLLQAIAQQIAEGDPTLRVAYLSAEQFMLRFVGALRERRTMEFKQSLRALDVLIVDDVQFIAGKESTQEEFAHAFNALIDQGKRIVLACDRPPTEITGLEDRVASRLQSGLVVAIEPADAGLRLAVLEAKLAQSRALQPDLKLGDGVVEFLATRITGNIRVLEGALTRLLARASLLGREVTVEIARDSLSDVLRAADRRVSVEEIQRRVAEHYNIRLADLVGPQRVRNLARPRQVAMYLAKTMTSRSLPDIGRRFGGRDHTTVIHGVRRIEELRQTDSQIAADLDALRRVLG